MGDPAQLCRRRGRGGMCRAEFAFHSGGIQTAAGTMGDISTHCATVMNRTLLLLSQAGAAAALRAALPETPVTVLKLRVSVAPLQR